MSHNSDPALVNIIEREEEVERSRSGVCPHSDFAEVSAVSLSVLEVVRIHQLIECSCRVKRYLLILHLRDYYSTVYDLFNRVVVLVLERKVHDSRQLVFRSRSFRHDKVYGKSKVLSVGRREGYAYSALACLSAADLELRFFLPCRLSLGRRHCTVLVFREDIKHFAPSLGEVFARDFTTVVHFQNLGQVSFFKQFCDFCFHLMLPFFMYNVLAIVTGNTSAAPPK